MNDDEPACSDFLGRSEQGNQSGWQAVCDSWMAKGGRRSENILQDVWINISWAFAVTREGHSISPLGPRRGASERYAPALLHKQAAKTAPRIHSTASLLRL
jgi:hypothetical protein